MNKRISGFGMIKSGVYENILVEGSGVAFGDVDVDHIKVRALLRERGYGRLLTYVWRALLKLRLRILQMSWSSWGMQK